MDREAVIEQIATTLQIQVKQVRVSIELIEAGNTIPFIARYRKEMTGELDEEQLRAIEEQFQYQMQLEERREEILRFIDEQGKLTKELRLKILQASKRQELEDLYLPFRPKRKTRASVAKDQGLEPLARVMQSTSEEALIEEKAQAFLHKEHGVDSIDQALQGAMDILAEELAEDAEIRKWVREHTWKNGKMVTVAKEAEVRSVYEMYYDYQEPVHSMPSHRALAVRRGEKEGYIKTKLQVDEEVILGRLSQWFSQTPTRFVALITQDGYKRLLAPSIGRELYARLMEEAEEKAIEIFSENLRQYLLQPPILGKTVLGIDPAFRTGCKLAVVDETGKLLAVEVIYPTPPFERIEQAKEKIIDWLQRYPIQLIAIGNGTASRETEQFMAELIQEIDQELTYCIVNEAGASVYSASKMAKEEFPDLDVAERSAISIARRLQDPLAELVKIDPKSVGVGQYQHDVAQKRLDESLSVVVESAVNYVGVDVNTASAALLQYVSGINSTVAKNIVKMKEEVGRFYSREQLKKVPRLGAKTFQQCVGFLRITEGVNPLDKTPIHPESYPIVKQLLEKIQVKPEQIGQDILNQQLRGIKVEELATELACGVPTLRDVIEALMRPGRDPREAMPQPIFRSDVLKIEDVKEGMHLQGTIRNVVDFGAFVDIGLKNDGLVHISKMSQRFVRNPMDIVTVGEVVDVWVLSVDIERDRVGLSMVPHKTP